MLPVETPTITTARRIVTIGAVALVLAVALAAALVLWLV